MCANGAVRLYYAVWCFLDDKWICESVKKASKGEAIYPDR